MKTAVLLPIKDARRAKHRLAAVLSPDERSALALSMFEDVSAALERTAHTVVIVTDSNPAAARARQTGWRVLWETAQISESRSVDEASAQLSADGFAAVLRVPGDIPLIRPGDVDEIHSALDRSRGAVAVSSWDGTGTNAILRSPPTLFASRFGPNSFALHREEARRVGASFTVLQNERVALDLDEARDLDRFLQLSSDTRTHDLLLKIGWRERMERRATEHLHSGS